MFSFQIWTRFDLTYIELPAPNKLTKEEFMAKGMRAHSRPSSAIHLIKEDGAPAILNPDRGSLRVHRPERTRQEKSGTAMRLLNEESRTGASRESKVFGTPGPATVLRELFELLEEFAPV